MSFTTVRLDDEIIMKIMMVFVKFVSKSSSLTIKGCVRLWVSLSHHFIISDLNAPSQCSDTELNI